MGIVYTEKEIKERVKELAKQIEKDYFDILSKNEKVALVGVLKGAFIFLGDLSREIYIPHTVDFVSIESYGKSGKNQGTVKLLLDVRQNLTGWNVILVEDIIDSGNTLNYLFGLFKAKQVKSLKVCSLLTRETSEGKERIDYLGFTIPNDNWLVGYGLDYNEEMRTLKYIHSI